jgi:iron complex outermembrane receptor protein
MNIQYGAAFLLLAAYPSLAQEAKEDTQPIDEIVVAGHSVTTNAVRIAVDQQMLVDSAMTLKNLPGADVNKNGTITGIAQYRGMYGDRVAVTIDSHAVVSGGPNAMDAPLSYVSPMITESIVIERGIASVSSAPESIGGHLEATLARGQFGAEDFGLSGFLGTRYSTNGNLNTSAGRITLSDASHRFSLLTEIDNGDYISTPAGVIRPSAVNRNRYDASYAFTNGESHIVLFAGQLDTENSGTPALPMDIKRIDTNLAGSHFLYVLSSNLSIDGRVALNDVEHVMDNFSLRTAPPPTMQRVNFAVGKGYSFALAGKMDFDSSSLRIGIDGIDADHDSTITNPNNAMFLITNFSDVRRDLLSAFAEWSIDFDASELELGVSVKRVDTSAGDVSLSGIMGNAPVMLQDAFNAADKNLNFDDIDLVAKYLYRRNDYLEWRFEAASKSRAPSYQELYLWMPMQSAGGLADGRTYIGDLGLQAEKSNELNIGVFLMSDSYSISPQIFYKQVDGYIQGVTSTNAAANMVSMMMNGKPALQFSNTDAEIWGVDVAWDYHLSEHFTVDGVATYARGRRTDVSDNLYRLAPPNGSVGLTYKSDSWSLGARLVAYAKQDEVSAVNEEQTTPAYELVNMDFVWNPTESVRLEARIDNLFDTYYQDHLTGINRAGGSDIPVGTRLPGAERSLSAGIIFSF